MITQPGVYRDLPEDYYHSDPVRGGSLSQSRAKVLLKPGGPARFHWDATHEQERKDHFDFGKAAHAEVLGVGAEWIESEYEAFRSKEAKEWKAAREAEGLVVLSATDAAKVRAMAGELAKNSRAVEMLSGAREVSLFAVDPDTGLWLRGRADAAPDGEGFTDYKTTGSLADPGVFASDAAKFKYHLQAAWYPTLNALTGSTFGDRFQFVVQEKEPPYLIGLVELDDTFLEIGHAQMRQAIDLYKRCRDADEWPGYPDQIITVAPPAWLEREHFNTLDPRLEQSLLDLAL